MLPQIHEKVENHLISSKRGNTFFVPFVAFGEKNHFSDSLIYMDKIMKVLVTKWGSWRTVMDTHPYLRIPHPHPHPHRLYTYSNYCFVVILLLEMAV